jgi:inositol phosphorylceramide mannosyltransferase catalytic subunit
MMERIPKRIIQTDKSHNLPIILKAATKSVRLNNPDFDYVFFDDRQVEDFIDTHFPEYRQVFDLFSFPIQKYDFFRYLAVYRLGGFYLDTDMLLTSSLTDLLEFSCVFPFERLTWSDYLRDSYGMDWEIGNYAFGAAAGHPFLWAIIQNILRAQKDQKWAEQMTSSLPHALRKELFVIYTTGPGLITRTLAEYPDAADQVEVLFPENVCDKKQCWNLFGNYGAHLGGGSWRAQNGEWRRRWANFLSRRNEERAIKQAQKNGATRSVHTKAFKYNESAT